MKRFQVECEHVVFPFGAGAPACVKKYIETARFEDLRPCDHKNCKIYQENEAKKETKKENQL